MEQNKFEKLKPTAKTAELVDRLNYLAVYEENTTQALILANEMHKILDHQMDELHKIVGDLTEAMAHLGGHIIRLDEQAGNRDCPVEDDADPQEEIMSKTVLGSTARLKADKLAEISPKQRADLKEALRDFIGVIDEVDNKPRRRSGGDRLHGR